MDESQEPSGQMSKVPFTEDAFKKNKRRNAHKRDGERRRYMSNFSAAVGILAFILLFATYFKTGVELGAYGTGSLAGRLIGFLIIAWILFSIGKALRSRFIANALFCIVMLIPIAGYAITLLRPPPASTTREQIEQAQQQIAAETHRLTEASAPAEEIAKAVIKAMMDNAGERDKPLFEVMRPAIYDLMLTIAEFRLLNEAMPPTPWEDYDSPEGLLSESEFWREYEQANARVIRKLQGLNAELYPLLTNAGLTPAQAEEKSNGFHKGFHTSVQIKLRESDIRGARAQAAITAFLADHFGEWEVDHEDGTFLFEDHIDFEPFNEWMKVIAEETDIQEQLIEQLPS